MPIGGVFAAAQRVVPYAIGVDFGCGVALARTNSSTTARPRRASNGGLRRRRVRFHKAAVLGGILDPVAHGETRRMNGFHASPRAHAFARPARGRARINQLPCLLTDTGSRNQPESGLAARPPVEAMIRYIDEHKRSYGVEPICRMLEIAPSTFHAAKTRPPSARQVSHATLGLGYAPERIRRTASTLRDRINARRQSRQCRWIRRRGRHTGARRCVPPTGFAGWARTPARPPGASCGPPRRRPAPIATGLATGRWPQRLHQAPGAVRTHDTYTLAVDLGRIGSYRRPIAPRGRTRAKRRLVGRGRIELPQPKARVLQTLGLTTCPTDPRRLVAVPRRRGPGRPDGMVPHACRPCRGTDGPDGDRQEGDGGDEGTRTPGLRDANAALSQLSYIPTGRSAASRPTGREV